ncbi:MAG: thiamine phosphate synthase [Thermoleophilum sp.]|nr:thiamine phosphate synthase [Thermoleophilum sp.]
MRASERRKRLEAAQLYLICPAKPRKHDLATLVEAALRGGVDMVQLREKSLPDDEVLAAAEVCRQLCQRFGALLWINDRPDLALAAGADGVHVGQDDLPPRAVRRIVGNDLLVGLSTHSPQQLERALREPVDEISVGPVFATPTKPGRPAAGLAYVRHAARHASGRPWFAIGGIDRASVQSVVTAGAHRIAVVRAICDADDPERAASELRSALGRR